MRSSLPVALALATVLLAVAGCLIYATGLVPRAVAVATGYYLPYRFVYWLAYAFAHRDGSPPWPTLSAWHVRPFGRRWLSIYFSDFLCAGLAIAMYVLVGDAPWRWLLPGPASPKVAQYPMFLAAVAYVSARNWYVHYHCPHECREAAAQAGTSGRAAPPIDPKGEGRA